MVHTFVSFPDAFEEDADRLGVKFATKIGYFWIRREREELVQLLRESIQSGVELEVTYDPATLEIRDVLRR
jgi:hypothetical protein